MDRDYVIVGGGLAGLTAARELHRLGCSTIVLEARDRVGGRAWYGKGPADVWVEFGGAYIHPSQPNVWQEVVDHSLPITAPTPPRSAAWLTCNNLRRGGPPVPYPEFSDLERAHDAWVEAARSLKDNRDRRSLDIPVSEFYASLALGPHTVDLLAAFFGEHCSNEWTEGSMLPFAQWLLETNSSVNDLIAGATLSPQLSNGTRSLVEAVALEAGEIRLRSPVRHVDQRSDAVEIATDDDVVTARAAVMQFRSTPGEPFTFSPRSRNRSFDLPAKAMRVEARRCSQL